MRLAHGPCQTYCPLIDGLRIGAERSSSLAASGHFPRAPRVPGGMFSMTSPSIPIVKLPLPRSPLPFEAAPETLKIARQSPVLRAELPDGSSGWLVTGFDEV